MHNQTGRWFLAVALLALSGSVVRAGDWPAWGRNGERNMVSVEKGLPVTFNPGKKKPGREEIDPASTKNVKWVVKLGSHAYGNPTVAGGKVFVGTNNESPRDPKHQGDRGVLMCFDEPSGRFLWQLAVPKLGAGKISDWEYLGICSSPAVEAGRVYLVSNRCEVLCLDANGLADGNQGPFKDEGQYLAGPGKAPLTPGPADADIIWRYDMREELGVFPHNITSSSVLILGERLFATTSNGVDWSHLNIPAPRAPALICLDKKTGRLLGEERSGISSRILHGSWSSPAAGKVNGKDVVLFGGPDGFCYGFDPKPVPDQDGFGVLTERWRYDGNPPGHRFKNGRPIKYATPEGPSEVIATPVFHQGRVYVAVGQDPEHGEGVGCLNGINAAGTGDISKSGALWKNKRIGRSLSTVSIAGGLLFIAEFNGKIHCLDASNGQSYWEHDTQSHIWGSTLVADGKVYLGTEDGDWWVFAADKKKKLLGKVELDEPIYASPIAANGVLYLATQEHLYALRKSGK